MRKRFGTLALITALVALGVPSAAPAKQHSPGHSKSAAKRCKALRAEIGRRDFAQAFGTGRKSTSRKQRSAFRRCVSRRGVLPKQAASVGQAGFVTPCPVGEPPLPVHAFVVGPCPPLPVLPGEPASPDDAEDEDEAEDEDAEDGDEAENDDEDEGGEDHPADDEDESD